MEYEEQLQRMELEHKTKLQHMQTAINGLRMGLNNSIDKMDKIMEKYLKNQ